MSGLLEKLGLHTPQLRAWAMYDWGNSAFITIIITAVFPIYFQDVAAADLPDNVATARFAMGSSVALIFVALLSPIFGALADATAIRKRLLAACLLLGVGATAGLFWVREGDWLLGLILFAIGNVGVLLSLVFYDSLLVHIAKPKEVDRVSTAGYALGYVGGGLLLLFCLAMVLKPETFGFSSTASATRATFLLTAVWWLLFTIPLFRKVPEPPAMGSAQELSKGRPLRLAFGRLRKTFKELRTYRQAFLLLLAVLIYNDGITTTYRMATIYGREIGLAQTSLITAIVMVQFVAIPFAFLFGALAGWVGTKRAILLGLVVYVGIAIMAYGVETEREFFVMAFMVAMVQGGVQALGRSLFASMIPKHKATEFFGFFGVAERFAAVLGPGVFALAASTTGSTRTAILSVLFFFVVGGFLLMRVDVEGGRETARRLSEEAA